jgi:TrbC/VIRB2 pilin
MKNTTKESPMNTISMWAARLTMCCATTVCIAQMAALRTAAGGTSGTNGFADVSRFLDNLATYCIYLAIPFGALGLIAAGGMLIMGNPQGTSWLAKTAVGVGIILLAKGIMS